MLMFVDEESESAMGDESAVGFSGRSSCCFCVSGELFISQQKFSEEVGDVTSADADVVGDLYSGDVSAGLGESSRAVAGGVVGPACGSAISGSA